MARATSASLGGNLLNRIIEGRDAYVVVLMIVIVAMMVIPLPTILIDFLIALNLGFVVLVLIVTLYSKSALALSTFPTLLLVSTLFRLALTISTTRLILSKAEAGEIIRTFGEFVVAGNVVVGLVIFLIITVVQFVVITKGAERIAEVGARFQLDSLPGKQMSIDAELRNGDITSAEARQRRDTLDQESQFYGAMDGAMKFVKGDAIAGLIIVAVNLIGGLTIGMAQQGMALAEAGTIYSLLTVGDGLVSQIPALFIAITAGMLVTRVASQEQTNLGAQIATQLTQQHHLLAGAGFVVMLASIVPGFPTLIFVAVGVLLMAPTLLAYRKSQITERAKTDLPEDEANIVRDGNIANLPQDDNAVIQVRLGHELGAALAHPASLEQLAANQTSLLREFGTAPPRLSFSVGRDAKDLSFEMAIEEFKIAAIDFAHERIQKVSRLERDILPIAHPYARGFAQAPGTDSMARSVQMIHQVTRAVLRSYFAENFSVDDMHRQLEAVAKESPLLVEAVRSTFPLPRLSAIFRILIHENVSMIRSDRILQALLELGSTEHAPGEIAAWLRSAARRQTCQTAADDMNQIPAIQLYQAAELEITDAGDVPDQILDQLAQVLEQGTVAVPEDRPLYLIVSADNRPHFVTALAPFNIDLQVLSYQDLIDGFEVRNIATLG